jgi:hypothetical protein
MIVVCDARNACWIFSPSAMRAIEPERVPVPFFSFSVRRRHISMTPGSVIKVIRINIPIFRKALTVCCLCLVYSSSDSTRRQGLLFFTLPLLYKMISNPERQLSKSLFHRLKPLFSSIYLPNQGTDYELGIFLSRRSGAAPAISKHTI